MQALNLFREKTGTNQHMRIRLNKQVPTGGNSWSLRNVSTESLKLMFELPARNSLPVYHSCTEI